MQKVILLVCKYIFKFQDSKKIIIGVDMFSAMSKEYASYTSILLSADFIQSSFVSSTPAGKTIVLVWINKV